MEDTDAYERAERVTARLVGCVHCGQPGVRFVYGAHEDAVWEIEDACPSAYGYHVPLDQEAIP